MQGAACIRVGNALGAGETAAAILTSKVSLICAGKHEFNSFNMKIIPNTIDM